MYYNWNVESLNCRPSGGMPVCPGEIVTNGGPSPIPGCDYGPLCIVYDATTKSGNAALVAFIGGDQAVQWRVQEVGY